MKRAILTLLRIYRRVISPHFPPACRFNPTCSEYAEESIRRHGVRRGIGLGVRRVLRCRPFGPSGYDPVP